MKDKIFVIQKHFASHLHWDLRLEINGVLKSWAVPKEPPRKPNIRRLAIQVQDHDLEYADFEGEIPKGNYGAGTVQIWDKGTYKLIDKKDFKIVFELYGNKLTGKYTLVQMKDKQWLLFKSQ
ncbi:MAG: DNA polymerase ligase N-terminal domain-containing protein [Nanobdellota archaeon]